MKSRVAVIVVLGLFAHQAAAYMFYAVPETPNRRAAELTPIELMANDKEGRSILVKGEAKWTAESSLGGFKQARPKLEAIATRWAPELFGQRVCEADVLARLEKLNQEISATPDPRELKSVLIGMRENDLIDDVLLLPLLKALPAYLASPAIPAPAAPTPGTPTGTPTNGGTPPANAPKPPEDLVRARSLFAGTDRLCPTLAYGSVVGKIRKEDGRKYRRAQFTRELEKAERLKVVGPELAAWLRNLHETKWDETPFTLSTVTEKMKFVKNIYLADGKKSEKSSFVSLKKKKSGGLTQRIAFYKSYTGEQMYLLSHVYFRFERRIGARSAELRFIYGDTDEDIETYQLSPTEQYRAAQKWLHKEFAKDMKISSIFDGRAIAYEDIVLAGLETGFIEAKNADLALKVDDLWNPNITKFEKIWNFSKQVLGYGMILVPPPLNSAISVGMALVEGVILNDGKNDTDPDDQGISLF